MSINEKTFDLLTGIISIIFLVSIINLNQMANLYCIVLPIIIFLLSISIYQSSIVKDKSTIGYLNLLLTNLIFLLISIMLYVNYSNPSSIILNIISPIVLVFVISKLSFSLFVRK